MNSDRESSSARRSFRTLRKLLFSLCGLLLAQAVWGQEVLPYVELGAGRKQGDFGSATRSTLWMGYATCGASGARWDANLTVPYLRLGREEASPTTQDQGIGDMVARGIYRFLPETEDGWSLDGQGALKLPTASDSKGLGTGRTDLGVFLALHQQLGLFRWTLQGGRIQGLASDPTGELTPGAFVLGLSGAWYLNGDRWAVSFESRGSTFQGLPGAREISLDVFHSLSSKWGMKVVVTAGLSDGGPKQSIGAAFIRIFP